MKERNEILIHIYKDCDMSVSVLSKLLKELKEKDNKIKDSIEDILKEYQNFKNKTKVLLDKDGIKVEKENLVTKIMGNMGVSKEVREDNSDSSIADMLVKGISMGSIDMEKKLSQYKASLDKDLKKFVESFLKFQENAINKLKKYL